MGSRNLELSIYVDGQSSLPRSEIVSGGDAKQNQGRGRRGSLQTGTNVFKDKYLPSLSLLPFAAATTVGILAPRQKSYGTGSSPSIFHACLPLSLSPSLLRCGGGVASARSRSNSPFPTDETLEEKTAVKIY